MWRKKKTPRRDFELQSSEPWGNRNYLSAQRQIQLIGFETNSVPFFPAKVSTFVFGIHFLRNDPESRAKKRFGCSHMP